MKKIIYMIISFFKYILMLWVPVLLIEETILFDYVNTSGAFICSLLMSILCLVVYFKTYDNVNKYKINCYLYNIFNTILFVITSLGFGYLFLHLIEINIFHQCLGVGWDCFLFGIEYLFIGFTYAFLSALALIIWLVVRLIKYIRTNLKSSSK